MSISDPLNLSTENDTIDVVLPVPVSKLDADQYSADDIDGVTESIFGSGNMAYASLQASQRNAAQALDEDMASTSDTVMDSNSIPVFGNINNTEITQSGSGATEPSSSDAIPTDTDRLLDSGELSGTENLGSEGHFSNITVGALGVSALSSDAGSFSPSSNLGFGGNNNIDSHIGGDTISGTSNSHVTVNNVTNNTNVDDTVHNIVNTINETVENITNLGDDLIENITNLGGDLIETVFEGDITEIVDILNTEIHDITDILNTNINNITDTVNNLLEETHLTEITNQVTDITNEVTGTVTNIVNETLDNILGGGIEIDLGSDLLASLGSGLHIVVDDSIAGNLETSLVSENLSALTENITGLEIPLISNLDAGIGFDLLGGSDPEDGSDITVGGLDLPDLSLDIVEDIIGDIDINVDLPEELLDPVALIEDIENLVENIDDISLADPEDILATLGEQGLGGGYDILLGNTELGDEFDLDINSIMEELPEVQDIGDLSELPVVDLGDALSGDLDGDLIGGLEDVLEDIEISFVDAPIIDDLAENLVENLDSVLNIDLPGIDILGGEDGDTLLSGLGDIVDNLTDDTLGGLDLTGDNNLEDDISWTESTIGDVGGLFDDVIGGEGSDADVLPDPIGSVAEGIGALEIVPNIGHLGGLFG